MKATLLRDFADVNLNPHHKLYRLDSGGEIDAEFVIVSTCSTVAGCETRVFACDEEGNGANYSEWLYDLEGLDHEAALRECGFEVGLAADKTA